MLQRFVCLLVLSGLSASRTDVNGIVAQLEARYRSARTLQATFLERYTENRTVVRVEAGTAYFRRPGKMRWEYESPEKNLFLVDGKTTWFYVPADHTVMRVPAKESTDWRTPLALLAGDTKVSRVCAQVEIATDENPESSEDSVLRCTLRGAEPRQTKADAPQPALQRAGRDEAVFLEINRETGDLVRVLVRGGGGVGIEFRFTNWLTNPPASDSLFRFHPPEGVAIVNGELPAGEIERK